MEFDTIAISDGVTMGTEGMKASLVSREVIADSIELVGRGHLFDGMVTLVGCDKTIPAAAMALLRLDLPSLVLYGGSIRPGRFEGRDVTIQDVFEGVGAARRREDDRGEAGGAGGLGLSRERAPAAVSTPPTPWLWRWRFWGCLRWATPPSPRRTRARTRRPAPRARSQSSCSARSGVRSSA